MGKSDNVSFCERQWKPLFAAAVFIFLTSCGPSPQSLSGKTDEAAANALSAAMSDLSPEQVSPERNIALIKRLQSDIPNRCTQREAALVCISNNLLRFQCPKRVVFQREIILLGLFKNGSYCRSEMQLSEGADPLSEHMTFSIRRVKPVKADWISIKGQSAAFRLAGNIDQFLKMCGGGE